MSTASQLQQLYVAYFGRAADPAGLDYWVAKGTTTKEFAAHMHGQNEFQSNYGSLSTESQVNQIYQNLFNRDADSTGLLYWTKQIETGVLELASIANDLIWAVENGHGDATDKLTLTAKSTTATAYTAEIRLSSDAILAYQADATSPWKGGEDFATAVTFMNTATSTNTPSAAEITDSVNTIKATDTAINGSTYVLTSSTATTTGTSYNDLFYAVTVGELTASDVVNGGAGADTLRFAIDEGDDPFRPVTTGVEHLRFTVVDNSSGAAAHTPELKIDLTTGVETIQVDNYLNDGTDDVITLSGLGTDVVVKLADNAGAAGRDNDLTIEYAAVTGTTDSATIKVDTTSANNTYGTITAGGIETLTIINSGKKTGTYALTADDATIVNIQGTASSNTLTAALATKLVADVSGDTTITNGDLTKNLTYDITVGSGATFTATPTPTDYSNLATAARTLSMTVKGAGKASLTPTLDWGDQTTYKDTITIDASTNTGGVTGDFSGWSNDNATYINFTGGTGADTVEVKLGDADKDYTIDGGAGIDTLQVDVDLGAARSDLFYTDTLTGTNLPSISNMEINKLIFSGATAARTVTTTSATLDTLELAGDIGGYAVTLDAIKSGQTVKISADTEEAASAIVLTVKDATATSPASSLTVTTSIDGVAAAATANIDDLRADTVTTLNLDLAGSDTDVTAFALDGLSANKASTVVITGGEILTVGTIDAADDATLDFTGHTGTVDVTVDNGNDYTVKGSSTAATTISMADGLDADDVITGGSSTADVLEATVTSLTTTTGKLNVSGVETIQLLDATTAATIDATSITGAETIIVTGDGTASDDSSAGVTFTNLAAGVDIQLGDGDITGSGTGDQANGYKSTVAIGLADATGSSDSVKVKLGATDEDSDITATLTGTGIETLTIEGSTTAHTATLDVSGFNASSVVITGGLASETMGLGTLSSSTTSFDASAYDSTVTVAGASGVGTSFSGKIAAGSFTGSTSTDTFTIASSAAHVAFAGTVVGGTGSDTLTVYAAASTDLDLVTGVETINLVMDDINSYTALVATSGSDGIEIATTINVSGGKAGQVYTLSQTLDDVALRTVDSTGLTGSLDYVFGNNGILVTDSNDMITLKAGSGTADVVRASFGDSAAGASGDFTMSGVETLIVGNDTTASTISLKNVTGLNEVQLTDDGGTVAGVTFTNVANNSTFQLGNSVHFTGADADLTVTLASATGSSDVLNVEVDNSAENDLTTNGIETLNITYTDGGGADAAHNISFAASSVTAGTINFTGTDTSDVVTVSGVADGYTTINASALVGGITIGAAALNASYATTFTGGTGNDSFAMENASDVLDAGTKASDSDTLVIAGNFGTGGFVVDLSSSTDQVTTYNGGTNSAVQKNFENIDLSSATVVAAATVTGSSGANTIKTATGAYADTVNAGLGADDIYTYAGADTINITEATQSIDTVYLTNTTAIKSTADIVTGFQSGDLIKIQATSGGQFGTLHNSVGTAFTASSATAGVVATANIQAGAITLADASNVIMIDNNSGSLSTGYQDFAAVNTDVDQAGIDEYHASSTNEFADNDELVVTWYNSTDGYYEVGIVTIAGSNGFDGADETFESLLRVEASTTTLSEVSSAISFIA